MTTAQAALVALAKKDLRNGTIRVNGIVLTPRAKVRKRADSSSPIPAPIHPPNRVPCALLPFARSTAFREALSHLHDGLVNPFAEGEVVPALLGVNCEAIPKAQKKGRRSNQYGGLRKGEAGSYDLTPPPVPSTAPNVSHLVEFIADLFDVESAPIKAEVKRYAFNEVGPEFLINKEGGKVPCAEVRAEALRQAGTLSNLVALFEEVAEVDEMPRESCYGASFAIGRALYRLPGEEGVNRLAAMMKEPNRTFFIPCEDQEEGPEGEAVYTYRGRKLACKGSDAFVLVALSVRKSILLSYCKQKGRSIRLQGLRLPPEVWSTVYSHVCEAVVSGVMARKANGITGGMLYTSNRARPKRNWSEDLWAVVDFDPIPWRLPAVLKWTALQGLREVARDQGAGEVEKDEEEERTERKRNTEKAETDAKLRVVEVTQYLHERTGLDPAICHQLVRLRAMGQTLREVAAEVNLQVLVVRGYLKTAEEYWTPVTYEEEESDAKEAFFLGLIRHHKKAKLDSRQLTERSERAGIRRALGRDKRVQKVEQEAWKALLRTHKVA